MPLTLEQKTLVVNLAKAGRTVNQIVAETKLGVGLVSRAATGVTPEAPVYCKAKGCGKLLVRHEGEPLVYFKTRVVCDEECRRERRRNRDVERQAERRAAWIEAVKVIEASATRCCKAPGCGKPITMRDGEKLNSFSTRVTCGPECQIEWRRSRRAKNYAIRQLAARLVAKEKPPDPPHPPCKCGKPVTRKTQASGLPEKLSAWLRRTYCSEACARQKDMKPGSLRYMAFQRRSEKRMRTQPHNHAPCKHCGGPVLIRFREGEVKWNARRYCDAPECKTHHRDGLLRGRISTTWPTQKAIVKISTIKISGFDDEKSAIEAFLAARGGPDAVRMPTAFVAPSSATRSTLDAMAIREHEQKRERERLAKPKYGYDLRFGL